MVRRARGGAPKTIGSGVYVDYSVERPHTGLGLYADQVFRKKDAISIYDGILMPWGSLPAASELTGRPNKYSTHLCRLKYTDFTISGMQEPHPGRGGASFANHARTPNAVLKPCRLFEQTYISGERLRKTMCLFAVADIEPGTEITFRYPESSCARLRIPYDS